MVLGPRRKFAYANIVFIWLSSVIIAITYSIRLQLVEGACMVLNEAILDSKGYVVFIGIAFIYIWCIPYFILIVTYFFTARALKANSFAHDNTRALELRNKQNAQIVKMFVIVVVIFLVMTMPYAIFYFYHWYMFVYDRNHIDLVLHYTINNVLFILSSANGCVNPILYAKMYREVNGYLRNVIHWIMAISCRRFRVANSDTYATSSR